MPSYNRNFELEIEDIAMIEMSLRAMLASSDDLTEQRNISELLGKLHNQKIWYRPPNNYISG